MYYINGITVDFSYNALEKKRYQAAGKALHRYKEKCFNRELKRRGWKSGADDRKESLIKFLVLLFFMFYELVLLCRSVGKFAMEQTLDVEFGFKLADGANTIGFACTVILVIAVIYFAKSNNNMFGYRFSEVLKEVVKYFLKAILAWAVVLVSIYLLSHFFTKDSTLYRSINRTNVKTEADEPKFESEMEDVLEEELDFVEENEEIDLRDQLVGTETLIEITTERATIYSDVDSKRELDVAAMGMQFIGTGEIQVSSDGSAWCEIYINSLRKKKAWVSIYDVKQIID